MSNELPYNERELLLRIAEGDEAAFARLVQHYSRSVYSHCLAYIRSVDSAEEVTQDIFVRIWQVRDRLATIESFDDYLYVVSRHEIYRAFRKKVGEMSVLTDEEDLNRALRPDLRAEFRDQYEMLLEGVRRLPEKRRMAFELSRLEGKTHAEIAAIMGIHKVTVAQYIMLAIDFLREHMKRNNACWPVFCMLALGQL